MFAVADRHAAGEERRQQVGVNSDGVPTAQETRELVHRASPTREVSSSAVHINCFDELSSW
jgi:hypothetical protein